MSKPWYQLSQVVIVICHYLCSTEPINRAQMLRPSQSEVHQDLSKSQQTNQHFICAALPNRTERCESILQCDQPASTRELHPKFGLSHVVFIRGNKFYNPITIL